MVVLRSEPMPVARISAVAKILRPSSKILAGMPAHANNWRKEALKRFSRNSTGVITRALRHRLANTRPPMAHAGALAQNRVMATQPYVYAIWEYAMKVKALKLAM